MIKYKDFYTLLNEVTYDVFRGDDINFQKFDTSLIGKSTGMDTVGFWFTDNEEAASFFGENVRKFQITLNNPLKVSNKQFIDNYSHGPVWWAKKAKSEKYDGVIIKDIMDGNTISTVFCVFNINQIMFKQ